jgi:4a-hydroxytetrahydrobiopterin dehydratase
MTDLADKSCAACRAGVPPATPAEIAAYLPQLPGWRITEADGIKRLEKSFSCKNFAAALALTNRIAVIAEQENHHPAIVTEWGRVTVSWWTHAIDGLHVNDFIMAARTDRACAVPVAKAPSSSGTA